MEELQRVNGKKFLLQLCGGGLVSIMWIIVSEHFDIVDSDGEFLLGTILFILTWLIIWILSEINFALQSCMGLLGVMAEPQVAELEKQSRERYVQSASAHQEFMNKLSNVSSKTNKTWECLRCGAKMSSSHSTCTNCGTKRG